MIFIVGSKLAHCPDSIFCAVPANYASRDKGLWTYSWIPPSHRTVRLISLYPSPIPAVQSPTRPASTTQPPHLTVPKQVFALHHYDPPNSTLAVRVLHCNVAHGTYSVFHRAKYHSDWWGFDECLWCCLVCSELLSSTTTSHLAPIPTLYFKCQYPNWERFGFTAYVVWYPVHLYYARCGTLQPRWCFCTQRGR